MASFFNSKQFKNTEKTLFNALQNSTNPIDSQGKENPIKRKFPSGGYTSKKNPGIPSKHPLESLGNFSWNHRLPSSNGNSVPVPMENRQRHPLDVTGTDCGNESVFSREIWKRDDAGFLAPPRVPVRAAGAVRRDLVEKQLWNLVELLGSTAKDQLLYSLMDCKQYVLKNGKSNNITQLFRNNVLDVQSVLEASSHSSNFLGQNKCFMQNGTNSLSRCHARNGEQSFCIGEGSIRGMNMSKRDQLLVLPHRSVYALKNWTILKEDRRWYVRLKGTLIDRYSRNILSRSYKTGIVVGRYGPTNVRTQDIDYILEGKFIDPQRRIPPEIRVHFQKGFPDRWREICEYWDCIVRNIGTSDRRLVVDLGERVNLRRLDRHQSDESSNGIEPFEESYTSPRSEPLVVPKVVKRGQAVEKKKRGASVYEQEQVKRRRLQNFSDTDEDIETDRVTRRGQTQGNKKRGASGYEQEPISKTRLNNFSDTDEETEARRIIVRQMAREVRTPLGRGELHMTLRSHSVKSQTGYKRSTTIVENIKGAEETIKAYRKTPWKRHPSPEATPKSVRRMKTRNHSWNRTKEFERCWSPSP